MGDELDFHMGPRRGEREKRRRKKEKRKERERDSLWCMVVPIMHFVMKLAGEDGGSALLLLDYVQSYSLPISS
jgi:hypothetical protein